MCVKMNAPVTMYFLIVERNVFKKSTEMSLFMMETKVIGKHTLQLIKTITLVVLM